MHVFKLGVVRVWMTQKGLEETEVHLHVAKGKATLSADEFRVLYEWFEEGDARLVRKSTCARKETSARVALGEDPKGKIWSAGLRFKLRKFMSEEEDKLSRKHA
jgi:hypothetical protein